MRAWIAVYLPSAKACFDGRRRFMLGAERLLMLQHETGSAQSDDGSRILVADDSPDGPVDGRRATLSERAGLMTSKKSPRMVARPWNSQPRGAMT